MCSSFERLLNKENMAGREQGREQGRAEGRAEGKVQDRTEAIIELLEDIGEPSETLRNHIMEQTDFEVLRKWLKIAAKAKSIEEFEQTIGLIQA